jgi:hypothetical protein
MKAANPIKAMTHSTTISRGEPVEILAFVQHELQRTDPHHQQGKADEIHPCFQHWGFVALQELPAEIGA